MQGLLRPKLKLAEFTSLKFHWPNNSQVWPNLRGKKTDTTLHGRTCKITLQRVVDLGKEIITALSKKHLTHLGLKEKTTIPISFLAPYSAFCSPFLFNYSSKSLSPYIRALPNSDEMIASTGLKQLPLLFFLCQISC